MKLAKSGAFIYWNGPKDWNGLPELTLNMLF